MSADAPTAGLVLVGCGKMGGALLAGWMERGRAAADVTVVEPDPGAAEAAARRGVRVCADAAAVSGPPPAVVVFAVKPQALPETAPSYARFAGAGTVFLSIAAGRPVSFFEDALGGRAAVVRSMPNTPAAVGRGISAACANANVDAAQRRLCQDLLEAVGEVVWLDDEGSMDAVTAVSGSGPAYVFLLIECLAEAGVAEGLAPETAARLARATVAGAGALARRSEAEAAQLRIDVTSPGGTTEAALGVLMAGDGLAPLMRRAVGAAARRSRELA